MAGIGFELKKLFQKRGLAVRMHRIGPCKFIPAVSHAIIIKWRTVIFYYGSGIWLSELNRNFIYNMSAYHPGCA